MDVSLLSRAASATHVKSKNTRAPLTAPVLWPRWVNEKLCVKNRGLVCMLKLRVRYGLRAEVSRKPVYNLDLL